MNTTTMDVTEMMITVITIAGSKARIPLPLPLFLGSGSMGIFMVNCDSEYQIEVVIMTKMGKIKRNEEDQLP